MFPSFSFCCDFACNDPTVNRSARYSPLENTHTSASSPAAQQPIRSPTIDRMHCFRENNGAEKNNNKTFQQKKTKKNTPTHNIFIQHLKLPHIRRTQNIKKTKKQNTKHKKKQTPSENHSNVAHCAYHIPSRPTSLPSLPHAHRLSPHPTHPHTLECVTSLRGEAHNNTCLATCPTATNPRETTTPPPHTSRVDLDFLFCFAPSPPLLPLLAFPLPSSLPHDSWVLTLRPAVSALLLSPISLFFTVCRVHHSSPLPPLLLPPTCPAAVAGAATLSAPAIGL